MKYIRYALSSLPFFALGACWSGLVDLPAKSYATGESTQNDRLGYQIASGNLDGDGIPDVVVSAPKPSFSDVYVFFGPVAAGASLNPANADVVFDGASGSEAGWSLAVGDVIGDGNDDLVIAAPSAASGAGIVYVFAGPLHAGALTTADAAATYTGRAGDAAGWSVATGDFDGDGAGEIVIGACLGAAGTTLSPATGRAYLVTDVEPGAWNLATAATDFKGGGLTGCAVASAGDFDRDGIEDFVIGAYGKNTVAQFGGTATLVYGRSTYQAVYDLRSNTLTSQDYLNLDMALILGPNIAGQNFGYAIANAGDVNGDGHPDLLFGAPAVDNGGAQSFAPDTAFIVLGGPGTGPGMGRPIFGRVAVTAIAAGTWKGEGFSSTGRDNAGIAVSSAGDINGDGFADMLVGSRASRTYLVYGSPYIPGKWHFHCTKGGWSVEGFGKLNCEFIVDDPTPEFDTYGGNKNLSQAAAIFEAPAHDFAGVGLGALGDVTGDGLDDIAIGAPRQAFFESMNYGHGKIYVVAGDDSRI